MLIPYWWTALRRIGTESPQEESCVYTNLSKCEIMFLRLKIPILVYYPNDDKLRTSTDRATSSEHFV